ncbi:DUF3842 family protein [Ruminococcaceae bacterium OttesenSCG-928-D13]|nr:DUF3842 family protein [Ruminococcaceae bacterium OttesenSCG-928-D13]
MKIVVIDGQGGRIGATLVEKLRAVLPTAEILAIGTNSTATAAMMKAGATAGATGENPILVACRDASYILGPLAIIAADALHGEVTPAMAVAIGQSTAAKILLPLNRCNHYVAGAPELTMAELVQHAANRLLALEAERQNGT